MGVIHCEYWEPQSHSSFLKAEKCLGDMLARSPHLNSWFVWFCLMMLCVCVCACFRCVSFFAFILVVWDDLLYLWGLFPFQGHTCLFEFISLWGRGSLKTQRLNCCSQWMFKSTWLWLWRERGFNGGVVWCRSWWCRRWYVRTEPVRVIVCLPVCCGLSILLQPSLKNLIFSALFFWAELI